MSYWHLPIIRAMCYTIRSGWGYRENIVCDRQTDTLIHAVTDRQIDRQTDRPNDYFTERSFPLYAPGIIHQ